MMPATQVKLLRVLERIFRRLGGRQEIPSMCA
jgi:DNA-binding NtrC family response regulator